MGQDRDGQVWNARKLKPFQLQGLMEMHDEYPDEDAPLGEAGPQAPDFSDF